MSLRGRAFHAEWRTIRRHRIVAISLIVMLFIPIMYGGFFLGSIWDPYGNTSHLPVAVVNEDTGASLDGRTINAGNDVVAELKKSDDMGWHFVDATTASAGIADGTYYMRIVIPADFSRNVATVTSSNPQKSTIVYTITPARNYIASLLTSEAARRIQQSVATNISAAYVQTILQDVQSLKTGMQTAAAGSSSLAAGTVSLQQGIGRYTDGVTALQQGQTALSDGLVAMSAGSAALKDGVAALRSGLPTNEAIAQLTAGVSTINAGLTALNASISNPSAQLVAQQTAATIAATTLQQTLVAYSTAVTTAAPSITSLQTAVANGQADATVNPAHVLAVVTQSQAVATDSTSLLTALAALNATLAVQQASLQSTVVALMGGMQSLSPNLTSALHGYTAIASGTTALAAGTNQLYAGTGTALQGSQALLAGTSALTTASPALITGASAVATGTQELSASLGAAADQLALQPTSDATKDQIVTPVVSQEIVHGPVPNYGFALSPYVLSLGLFVGALAFNVIYPVRRYFATPDNARAWWFAKMSVASAVAVGQALVLDLIMVAGLGLRPDQPLLFVLATIITSLTYMSIITLLAIALDNVGRFLAMVLLVLQLGAAGGVFPIVLSSHFFQAVNPFVPMTYSIYAYRQAISSGLGNHIYWGSMGVLMGILVGANLLLLVFLRRHGMRHFHHESVDDSN